MIDNEVVTDPTLQEDQSVSGSVKSESGSPLTIPKDEQQVVKELLSWVTRCRGHQEEDGKTYAQKIKEWRQYVAGRQKDDGKGGISRANLIQANIKKSTNRIYAKDPAISIVPNDFIDPEEIKFLRDFGKTSELFLNHHLRKVRFKRKAKYAVRSAKTSALGWVKVVLQTDLKTDPIIMDRLHDAQDNLAKLNSLTEEIEDAEGKSDEFQEGMIAKQEQLIEALKEDTQIRVADGFAIANVLPENMIIDPLVLRNFDEFDKSPRVGELIPMSREEAIDQFGKDIVDRMTKMGADTTKTPGSKDSTSGESNQKEQLYWVYEIWDQKQMKVYTVSHDYEGYLRKPYTPKMVGERWYPYFGFGLNYVDGEHRPLSDVELSGPLQDEINETLTNFREHRRESIPFFIGLKANWPDSDRSSIKRPKGFEIVLVEGNPESKASDLLDVVEPPRIDPNVYSVEHLERLIEKVTSGGDFTQPRSNRSGTLGEAELLGADIQQDGDADQDEIENWFAMIVEYMWEISLLAYSKEEVESVVGPGAVWHGPVEDRKQAFRQMRMTIQPGSSGKPNKAREQASLSKIMPVVQEMIMQWAQSIESGNEQIAEIQKRLIQEFLRRADEKIDVDEFFPQRTEEDEQQKEQEQIQQQQQQIEQLEMQKDLMEAELEKLRAETDKIESETDKNIVEAHVKAEGIKTDQAKTAISLADGVKRISEPPANQQPN